ncbi:hypothetical protein GPALN_003025 [Globodera pallida]|nr:hypothetical protein GPALN_003025 [Globodera pallida]
MKCKEFMRKLMSEEGEGSWLNIYTFIVSPLEQYNTLRNIHELAKVQSAKLDEMINEAMWQEHEQTRSVHDVKHKHVIVEGAGPIGLFSVFHLFLAGASVTVLNDRPERYTRNQMTFIDAKFVAQFRLFLGTKFDKLYIDEKALARINTLDGEVGQQNVKLLEQVFKERLVELATFVESKIGHKENRLTLLYQTALKDTDGTFQHAIIGASSKFNVDQQLYTKRMVEVRAKSKGIDLNAAKKTIFDEKVERILQLLRTQPGMAKVRATDAVIEHPLGKNGKITVNRQAEWEMEGKATELLPVHFKPIPFDILFCAGGAHDQIRDDLLGKPVRRSISKNYGIVVFEKGNPDENVFDNLTAFFNVKMRAFEPILRRQKFDQFVENHKNILPKKFFEKYRYLTQLIVRGLAHEKNNKHEVDHEDRGHTKPIYKTDANGHFVLADQSEDPRQIVRLFENRPTLHVASITPPAVEEFVRDIKKELRSEKSAEKQKQINEIRLQFERKWSAAIFDMCLKNGHPEKVGKITINMDADGVPGKQFSHNQLNIDPHPANTSTFALTIFAVENAVRAIDRESKATTSKATTSKSTKGKSTTSKSRAIIAAIGDANTSPHFMTTSGLSTGKRVIKKVREYVTIVDKEGKNEAESSNLDKNEANWLQSDTGKQTFPVSHDQTGQNSIQIFLNVNKAEIDGERPLRIAALHGHLPVVRFLVENGADINATDRDSFTPLMSSAREGHPLIVQFLLDRGADKNLRSEEGMTAAGFVGTSRSAVGSAALVDMINKHQSN